MLRFNLTRPRSNPLSPKKGCDLKLKRKFARFWVSFRLQGRIESMIPKRARFGKKVCPLLSLFPHCCIPRPCSSLSHSMAGLKKGCGLKTKLSLFFVSFSQCYALRPCSYCSLSHNLERMQLKNESSPDFEFLFPVMLFAFVSFFKWCLPSRLCSMDSKKDAIPRESSPAFESFFSAAFRDCDYYN